MHHPRSKQHTREARPKTQPPTTQRHGITVIAPVAIAISDLRRLHAAASSAWVSCNAAANATEFVIASVQLYRSSLWCLYSVPLIS